MDGRLDELPEERNEAPLHFFQPKAGRIGSDGTTSAVRGLDLSDELVDGQGHVATADPRLISWLEDSPFWERSNGDQVEIPVDPDPDPDPPSSTALALSRGPTGSHWGPDCNPITGQWGSKANQYCNACDLTNSIGINHKPHYLPGTRETALDRIEELGIQYVRIGLHSPANHTDAMFFSEVANFLIRAKARGIKLAADWGASEESKYMAAHNFAVATYNEDGDTWLRPLDGPAGDVVSTNWAGGTKWAGEKKFNPGHFYDIGWDSVGMLQGANEPDGRGERYAEGPGSLREQLHGLKQAKLARTSEVVLGGDDYVSFDTGRLTPGPAHANQIPVAGFALVNRFNWPEFHDYTNRADIDVGSPHIYYGGAPPVWENNWPATWGADTDSMFSHNNGYNGRYAPGGYLSRTLPLVCTETGYITDASQDPGFAGPQRFCPPNQAGEYLLRTIVEGYSGGLKLQFIYKLTHETGETTNPGIPAMGLCESDYTRLPCFEAIVNFIDMVGMGQGPNNTPVLVPHTFSPGADDFQDPGLVSNPHPYKDRFTKVIVRLNDTQVLVIGTRNRSIWDRYHQTVRNVADLKNVVYTIPAGWNVVGIREPSKNSLQSATDGQAYANPNDGTAYEPPGTAGNGFTVSGNKATVRYAGLMRCMLLEMA